MEDRSTRGDTAMSRRLALIPLRPRYWDVVKDGCGITRKQYDLYYQDQEIAIAYRLGKPPVDVRIEITEKLS